MLAGRSKEGVSAKAVAAAAPNVPPSIRHFRKAAPPGGRSRTATSISGRVISASSAVLDRSGVIGPSTLFIAKIATAGYADRTIQDTECVVLPAALSQSDGRRPGTSGDIV